MDGQQFGFWCNLEGYQPCEELHYKKSQTLSISFPIKYSLLHGRAKKPKPQAFLTLCCSNNRVL